MSKILIVYGTTDGHTQKIAAAMKAATDRLGFETTCISGSEALADVSPVSFDGVMVAASLHAGGYQKSVRAWVKHNAHLLNQIPSAFVSVCLGVLENRAETKIELKKLLGDFFFETGWRPPMTEMFAGALTYTHYNWLKRRMMKSIAAKAGGPTDTSRDYEFTDWDELGRFVVKFLSTQQLLKFIPLQPETPASAGEKETRI